MRKEGSAISERDEAEIGPILLALADPTRRSLLNALAEEGTASATRLAGRLPVSRQAVVKHLQVLQDAGLVTGARAGREVLYEVDPQPLDTSARWLANLAATWDRRLAALKRAAETPTHRTAKPPTHRGAETAADRAAETPAHRAAEAPADIAGRAETPPPAPGPADAPRADDQADATPTPEPPSAP